jgi:hypothetical protein
MRIEPPSTKVAEAKGREEKLGLIHSFGALDIASF